MEYGPLFESATPAARREALNVWLPMEVGAGELLMRQGDSDPALIYILDGLVEILRDGFAIDTSGKGEVVGEISLFGGGPRVATVRALAPTRFLVVDRDGYEILRDRSNEIAFQLERLALDQQAHRLRRLDRLVAEFSEGSASPWYKPKKTLLQRWSALFAREAPPPEVNPAKLDVEAVLEASPMFADERHTFVRGLVGNWRQETHPAGTFVCAQGEIGSTMYILARGSVEVVVGVQGDPEGSRIQRLATLGPGDAFGLTGLYDGRPRAASCVAKEEIDLLVLDRDQWVSLYEAQHQIGSTMRRAAIRAFGGQLDDAAAAYLQAIGAMGEPELDLDEPDAEPDSGARPPEPDLEPEPPAAGPAMLAVPGMSRPGPPIAFRAQRPGDPAEPPMMMGARLEMLRRADYDSGKKP